MRRSRPKIARISRGGAGKVKPQVVLVAKSEKDLRNLKGWGLASGYAVGGAMASAVAPGPPGTKVPFMIGFASIGAFTEFMRRQAEKRFRENKRIRLGKI